MRPAWIALLALPLACSAASGDDDAQDDEAASTASRRGVFVKGNALVDASGHPVRLLGVNHVGAEYMCIHGEGVFDSPSPQTAIDAMLRWNIDAVRLPLNEQCWLGGPELDARFSGDAYRRAIGDFVGRLRARGVYVILTPQWSSSIAGRASRQQPMLDRANGLPFWRSIATTFAKDQGVLFDLYSEPYLDTKDTTQAYDGDVWQCWQKGCIVTDDGETYEAAGMQAITDEIRGAGAHNVLLVSGLGYANDAAALLDHLPRDPAGALAASFHVYPTNNCRTAECWDRVVAPIAGKIPVVAGEIGEYDCRGAFIEDFMTWSDRHGVSYLGWAFNTGDCGKRPSLLVDWRGTATPFGAALRDHLSAVRAL